MKLVQKFSLRLQLNAFCKYVWPEVSVDKLLLLSYQLRKCKATVNDCPISTQPYIFKEENHHLHMGTHSEKNVSVGLLGDDTPL